ncbi:MAG: pitrilysin family protein [Candidatus Aminicenantes bacterium]|nr:pitrilysin family protein [Candidatus Aminicenantes bacterium]
MQISAALLLLSFLPGRPLFSQDKADATPAQAAGKTWKNRPERIRVEDKNNGAPFSFIFHRDTSSGLTVLRLFIAGGKKAEPPDRKGLAFLTTRLSVEIPETTDVIKLMTLGSSIATDVNGDHSIITVTCLSENLEETLKILMGVLTDPLISSLRISYIKKAMEHQQKNEEDNTGLLMGREYFTVFFGNSGYGGSIFGTATTAGAPNSLKTIKKKDIADFYKTFFNRSHMVIVVSSDLSKAELEPVIKKYFRLLPAGQETPAPGKPGPGEVKNENNENNEKKEYFFKKENTQALVSLGALLPGMGPHHFVCAYMLENLLGDGIGSKLWPLRAELNLAYSLKARTIQMKDAGVLWMYLKTDNSRKEKAREALTKILTDLYQNGVGEEEFAAAKIRTRAHFLRSNETKETRTFYLGLFEQIGPGFEFLENFFSAIETVTPGDFNAYIKEVLKPERLVKIVIGPGQQE